ncbi:hypothetical protein ACIBCN_33215 [Nocardia sp. NPDC051052]|uniref:hypothetical protein n=1 Tax=Nocardia sp. NPDC051052 TaxID=3364322 RepID=UPI0037A46815
MSKLEVDPKVYYQAAVNCFDAAAALNDSFKYVFGELNSCGQMAGRDEDGRAWASSYDESARDAVSFFDQTFSTLRACAPTAPPSTTSVSNTPNPMPH